VFSARKELKSYTTLYNVSELQSSKFRNLSSVNSQPPLFRCHCATSRKVAGSIPDGIIRIIH